ncbi:sensor histidine kinase YesM [Aquimarina sp. MAR_2010_214]|uniref:histidine kinase n=1 Tax=Aquimarina sp. MAR_2010_214 TaxID=1250026 RepID=UPI000C709F39|nr:histidine kinase [Aquimarina sp. MAR_2010_214]PKV51290.1 sensor histidine kinase YesM [Aquimarina sp. MAR_2010_214]
MNFRLLYRFLILITVILVSSCSRSRYYKTHDSVYMHGDQSQWATKDWDHQHWKNQVNVTGGEVFWSRTEVEITKAPELFQRYGVFINTFGEYDVFWDGVLIGENGNPGQEATHEPSGELWATFNIPDTLATKGSHVLALKTSLYYFPNHWRKLYIHVDDYDHLVRSQLINTAFMHIFAGAFLIASLYFFFLFLSEKKGYPILIFSTSCFLFFALIMMEYVKFYVPIHYSQHHIRLEIIGGLTFCIAILVPLYFSLQFPFPKRKAILITYIGVLVFVFLINHYSYDFTAYNMAITMWIFSFGIILFGVYKKTKGAIIVLLALLSCALINAITYYDISLFAGFGIILLGMFYILSVRTKEQRLAYEESLVQSTRLRLELLKKNIQPHFLMNTLTSLIDWVEESPQKGVAFIEALAQEFKLFNQIDNHTLIPIGQEIELCRTHLNIMEYRKEIKYHWEEENIDPNQKIPPAILHTLLENGITHGLPNDNNSITFKLIFETGDTYKTYTFLTIAKVRDLEKKIIEGTGIKYIKARLTESYASKWNFSSEATPNGWKNSIKIDN